MTLDRITVDPRICLGQPTVRGMRITISVIVKLVASGKSVDEIVAIYPELEAEDIQQALQYAAWVVSDQTQPAAREMRDTSHEKREKNQSPART